tara:strand:- start:7326 stop:7868 length:543 start_codon:yes stop_codon:yes gene_type:complete
LTPTTLTHALEELSNARDEADYLRYLIKGFAIARFDDCAFRVLGQLNKHPFIGVSDDSYNWPYAGAQSGISLLEEMVWLSKQTGSEKFDGAFDRAILTECKILIATIAEAELDLLFDYFCSFLNSGDTFYAGRIRDHVSEQLVPHVKRTVEDFDMEGFRDAWVDIGIADRSQFEYDEEDE